MTLPVPAASGASVASRIASIRQRFEPLRPDTTARTVPTEASSTFEEMMAAAFDRIPGGVATDAAAPAAAPGGSATSGASLGDRAVSAAMEYQGIPYLWGGTDPSKGLDCSGFVQHVYRSLGIELPRVSRDQARQGQAVPSMAEARPGDLIAFGSPVDHIAIYVGDNKIIHAPRTGQVIKVTDIYRTPTAIRRLDGGAPAVAAGAASAPAAAGGSTIMRDPAVARYAHLFTQAGARHGIDPSILAAVAKVESGGNPTAVSPAGARGLMQFMPATARGYGIDPLDPAQAIDGAARMLTEQRSAFGSLELALAAYNAGPGAVRRHGGIPPYAETQNYVRKVMSHLVSAS